MPNSERRQRERYTLRIPLRFRALGLASDKSEHFTEVLNISRGGFFFVTSAPLQVGMPIEATFRMPAEVNGGSSHETHCRARLVHAKPKDKGMNKLTVNLPWDAMSFVIDGKRYTAAYFNHPSNPGESRWSERDYARFGCYFEYDLTPDRPLVVNYRVWLQDGEMTGEQVAAMSKAFVQPPKVTVK